MSKIKEIISRMTLEDKVAFCSGADFWHTKAMSQYEIPEMMLSDGPSGLRKQESASAQDMLGINKSVHATCFPSASTTASSFDPAVTECIGRAIGVEALAQKVGVVLGPGANLKRNPLCGRNFEYFSEDPYLSGKMAAGWIRGLEGVVVASCLKHFACNNQEKSRFNSDSILDERTLREMYLSGFEIAVKEGKPSSVMSAYNKINGVYCSDNRELLTDILRNEWGFDGFVVTDWGGMSDRIAAFRAGCDLLMPGGSGYMEKDTIKAVRAGLLDEKEIDKSVERILKQVFEAHQILNTPHTYNAEEHNRIAREAAEKSAVLLKNDLAILPLNEEQRIVLIGSMAKEMRYQGTGSSHINPFRITTPCDAMPNLKWHEGCLDDGSTTNELVKDAVAAAKNADVVVIFAGLPDSYESEGFDRSSMKMPDGQLCLIDEVAEANPNTVVVLFSGCALECPWADKVKAILFMGLPGQAGGEAVKNLLFGKAVPSGKLAESWPVRYEDCASSNIYAKTKDALYEEGIYVGYRYYEKAGKPVRFPFGYGLSYTSFVYSDLKVVGRTVSVTVTNTGKMSGAEAVLLWVHPPQNGIHRPVRELKAFDKLYLQAGESKTVTFVLNDRSFAIWQNGWKVPGGNYKISVADLTSEIYVDGETVDVPEWQKESWYQNCNGKPSRSDLEKALGHEIVLSVSKKGEYTMDNSIMEMKETSVIMKIMFRAIESTIAKQFNGKKDYANPEFRMMINSSAGAPLRSMQISAGIKDGLFEGLLEMANGSFFRGISKIMKSLI